MWSDSAPKAGLHHMPANVPFYLDYSKNATSYESLGLWTFFYGLVGEKDSVVRVPGTDDRRNLQHPADTAPARHLLHKRPEQPGADKVIVLTQSYWQTQYQESPEVLGTRCGSTMKRTR